LGGLIWVGFVAFFVVALTVGVRVLLLARRTRELPELLMGIGVLGIGPVGFGLMVVAGFYLRFIRTRASRLEALAAG
jgi:hypothetical protein